MFTSIQPKSFDKVKKQGTKLAEGKISFDDFIKPISKSVVINFGDRSNSDFIQLKTLKYPWYFSVCIKTCPIGMYKPFALCNIQIFSSCVHVFGHHLKVPSTKRCKFGSLFHFLDYLHLEICVKVKEMFWLSINQYKAKSSPELIIAKCFYILDIYHAWPIKIWSSLSPLFYYDLMHIFPLKRFSIREKLPCY
ncbi:unnamed protein product [Moneuplotes crassus]|uniref:Uncharacterized protein n=1 Tax=Euplotes crassus TaxID=5936 RepID=A0AAD1X6I9_EUPCR|nr:unnamed protein product [Moneuplotes crassus]